MVPQDCFDVLFGGVGRETTNEQCTIHGLIGIRAFSFDSWVGDEHGQREFIDFEAVKHKTFLRMHLKLVPKWREVSRVSPW